MDMDPKATYTFIGDVHGQAPTLHALLEKLGWTKRQGHLKPRHREHLVFVGDLIDRGPRNLETVEVVRQLVEQRDATCLMGNHEFNAVHFHTPHPLKPGTHLREQSDKNQHQHQAVLDELDHRPGFLRDMLAWFKTLPVAVEGPGWRCVHACWHEESLKTLTEVDKRWHLPADAWVAAATKDTDEYEACENLMKGPEQKLPDGGYFIDSNGIRRHHARIRWWASKPKTLEDALIIPTAMEGIAPDAAYHNKKHSAYQSDAPPVFFGHYWNRGEPSPEAPNAVCLDYSAGRGKDLVAYRLEKGRPISRSGYIVQSIGKNTGS